MHEGEPDNDDEQRPGLHGQGRAKSTTSVFAAPGWTQRSTSPTRKRASGCGCVTRCPMAHQGVTATTTANQASSTWVTTSHWRSLPRWRRASLKHGPAFAFWVREMGGTAGRARRVREGLPRPMEER